MHDDFFRDTFAGLFSLLFPDFCLIKAFGDTLFCWLSFPLMKNAFLTLFGVGPQTPSLGSCTLTVYCTAWNMSCKAHFLAIEVLNNQTL